MPNNFVPDVPEDWAEQHLRGTPYRLAVVDGASAWVPTVVFPILTANDSHVVTANSGLTVFIQPA